VHAEFHYRKNSKTLLRRLLGRATRHCVGGSVAGLFQSRKRGRAFFLFGHTALLRDADPLTVAWTSGRRQPVRLTD
jgi:hypothetical protein